MSCVRAKNVFATAGVTTALALSLCAVPNVAFASEMDQLKAVYADALKGYESALDEQDQNNAEIAATEREIAEATEQRDRAQGELDEIAVKLYKDTRKSNMLLDLLLDSSSFSDAVMRYELFEKVEGKCITRIQELAQQRDELEAKKVGLEVQKAAIKSKVEKARLEAEEAEEALIKASHADGDEFHQVQGNGSNCGATAFIVGVNILLGEEEYDDNVEVWNGPGFNGDSTTILATRAKKWLKANDLSDEIGVEEVKGDIHDAEDLQEYLEEGSVVVISSGSGSPWRYADKPNKAVHNFPDGHWVVFYYYDAEEDTFYCNDSSVKAKKGAGCPYTFDQMQDWLDGRGNHFATVLYKK